MLRNAMWLPVLAGLLAGGYSVSASGGDGQALETSPYALPAVSAPAPVADASSCAGLCQARHDHCRVSTKGGPACDGERQRCVQACLAKKAK